MVEKGNDKLQEIYADMSDIPLLLENSTLRIYFPEPIDDYLEQEEVMVLYKYLKNKAKELLEEGR